MRFGFAAALTILVAGGAAWSGGRVSDLRLQDLHGKPVRLSDMWKRGGNGVLVLPARSRQECRARHGCMQPEIPIAVVFDTAANGPALLIDPSEKIRREFLDAQLDVVLNETAGWVRGMRSYDVQCSGCHGYDGGDKSYPKIKPLAGIGQRCNIDEIIEQMSKMGKVDLSAMDEEAKRALAAYVSTL